MAFPEGRERAGWSEGHRLAHRSQAARALRAHRRSPAAASPRALPPGGGRLHPRVRRMDAA
ncbi:hypothetical protein CYQ11_05235 [Streptomyces cinnamoneus]|nr:hypothetical protein CYQ11_05235 [Streptomyces cinnamoneus]